MGRGLALGAAADGAVRSDGAVRPGSCGGEAAPDVGSEVHLERCCGRAERAVLRVPRDERSECHSRLLAGRADRRARGGVAGAGVVGQSQRRARRALCGPPGTALALRVRHWSAGGALLSGDVQRHGSGHGRLLVASVLRHRRRCRTADSAAQPCVVTDMPKSQRVQRGAVFWRRRVSGHVHVLAVRVSDRAGPERILSRPVRDRFGIRGQYHYAGRLRRGVHAGAGSIQQPGNGGDRQRRLCEQGGTAGRRDGGPFLRAIARPCLRRRPTAPRLRSALRRKWFGPRTREPGPDSAGGRWRRRRSTGIRWGQAAVLHRVRQPGKMSVFHSISTLQKSIGNRVAYCDACLSYCTTV